MSEPTSITETAHAFPIPKSESSKLDELRGELTEEPFLEQAQASNKSPTWMLAGMAGALLGISLLLLRKRW